MASETSHTPPEALYGLLDLSAQRAVWPYREAVKLVLWEHSTDRSPTQEIQESCDGLVKNLPRVLPFPPRRTRRGAHG